MSDQSKIYAPFTIDQCQKLNRRQTSRGDLPPYTCGNDSLRHPILIAMPSGWVCDHPNCGYTQDWAWNPDFTPDPIRDYSNG